VRSRGAFFGRVGAWVAVGALAAACGASGPTDGSAGRCPALAVPLVSVDLGPLAGSFRVAVTNAGAYSDALFAPSPDLPPCGANANSSRTWVEFRDERGPRLYGYCGIQAASELASRLYLPFALTPSDATAMVVVLTDRRCATSVSSQPVALPSR
jgi:hypothetical protein